MPGRCCSSGRAFGSGFLSGKGLAVFFAFPVGNELLRGFAHGGQFITRLADMLHDEEDCRERFRQRQGFFASICMSISPVLLLATACPSSRTSLLRKNVSVRKTIWSGYSGWVIKNSCE